MSDHITDDGESGSAHRAAMGRAVSAKLARNPMISRIPNERLEIHGRHNFLSDAECDALVALIEAGCEPSRLFSGTGNASYRTSDSCNLDPWDRLVSGISDRIAGTLGIPADHGESLQGQRYRTGQEYKAHCDFFPTNASYWPAMRASGGQRCWTAMIYLNTIGQGGETHFIQAGFMVPPKKGMILIWNNLDSDGAPNRFSLHAARPVEAGTKYVVTKWFRERPWIPAH